MRSNFARFIGLAALAMGAASTSCSSSDGSTASVDGGGSVTDGSTNVDADGATDAGHDSATDATAADVVTGGDSSGATDAGADVAIGTDASVDGSIADAAARWQPTTSQPIHFHWMIGGFSTTDLLPNQDGQVVYDIDGEGATAAEVAAIHAKGAIAVCYVDVGTLEMGRSDYAEFPKETIGPGVAGWPGENWLLVTAANQAAILPLMKARFADWCQAKGFDAIEPDNVDAWTNISGVSEADNVTYDLAIGQLARDLGMSVGLKNVMTDLDPSQYASFLAVFDWALNEQCFENSECGVYTAAGSFLPAGKAVFDVEYNVDPTCATADTDKMNAQRTDLDLVGATASGYSYAPCIPDTQTTW
jgi:hypothetical protein